LTVIYQSMLGALAVWRVTHMLTFGDGPWSAFRTLRQRAGQGFWGELLNCFYCLSMWAAAPFALVITAGWRERVLLWPALSGGAILLERLTAGEPGAASRYYVEDAEPQADVEDGDVLR
jgi:Protein of unknown function (DUF1360)